MTNTQHRVLNTVISLVLTGAAILYVIEHKHNIQDCEDRLWEHITKTEVPKDIR